ncbi:MAG: hypothetical protein A3D65_03975 [Candidatus Lloydbacteria bacterium RIFCSPHIGHO2_02_FULL_50_13]|uniref:Uncharacterized protein n=1 Tax=Candidatus Lloydbacteria bacterium RIFCSPHIGHO2_02_FULL_50_13 TaxID=1798661 RepID=A0A1G2D9B1_9BACT|nr:MAG: hypothetical protein A3D65_03975 [Candidatus Lloydbacteria bacterium RIFCSPHIGHO2_02_FULL_50_13]
MINPHEIQRLTTLALVAEPLAEKDGCATRTKDLSEDLKLTHFLAVAVNSGEYFYELAQRVVDEGGQPKVFYDLCHEALKNSNRNSKSQKYINNGLLGVLFPFVLARLISDKRGEDLGEVVLEILKKSSVQDVQFREKCRNLAWSTSTVTWRRVFPSVGGSNLHEYYENKLNLFNPDVSEVDIFWTKQFLSGFLLIKEMYLCAKTQKDSSLILRTEIAYRLGMQSIKHPPLVADYNAVVNFLLLSEKDGDSTL